MSYFSHNPEAWDEIEHRGVARKLASIWVDVWNLKTAVEQEEVEEKLAGVFSELTCGPRTSAERKLWDALTDWAREDIQDQEQAYWERFIP